MGVTVCIRTAIAAHLSNITVTVRARSHPSNMYACNWSPCTLDVFINSWRLLNHIFSLSPFGLSFVLRKLCCCDTSNRWWIEKFNSPGEEIRSNILESYNANRPVLFFLLTFTINDFVIILICYIVSPI